MCFIVCCFGGAWKTLEKELVKHGLSNSFSKNYISVIRKKLGQDEAQRAIMVFDHWEKTNDEKTY